jgi:hypothetical protein
MEEELAQPLRARAVREIKKVNKRLKKPRQRRFTKEVYEIHSIVAYTVQEGGQRSTSTSTWSVGRGTTPLGKCCGSRGRKATRSRRGKSMLC